MFKYFTSQTSCAMGSNFYSKTRRLRVFGYGCALIDMPVFRLVLLQKVSVTAYFAWYCRLELPGGLFVYILVSKRPCR